MTNISSAIDFEVPHILCYVGLPLLIYYKCVVRSCHSRITSFYFFPKIRYFFLQRCPSKPYNWRHSSCKFSRGLPALALFLCSYQEIQFHCHLFITMIVAIVITTSIIVIFITNLIWLNPTIQWILSWCESSTLSSSTVIHHSHNCHPHPFHIYEKITW